MAFGGPGVSLAGFAAVISALDRGPKTHPAVAAYRIRGIVFLGFGVMFVGFGTVALCTVTGHDLTTTVRVASLALALIVFRGLLEARPGPAWPKEGARKFFIGQVVVVIAVTLGNVAYASLGYLQLLMLLHLSAPVTTFYNTVRDATASDSSIPDPDPKAVEG